MKATIIKLSNKKEVINRLEIEDIANAIKKGAVSKEVKRIREVYHLMKPVRHEDGRPTEDARWLSIDDIKQTLGCCYASFDPETTNNAVGYALNDAQFNFEVRRTSHGMEYKMVEK